MEELGRDVDGHEEARHVRALLQLRELREDVREDGVDGAALAAQERRAERLAAGEAEWVGLSRKASCPPPHAHVGRQRELNDVQKVDHARRGNFRRLIADVNAVRLVELRKHVVAELQELLRRLLVKGDLDGEKEGTEIRGSASASRTPQPAPAYQRQRLAEWRRVQPLNDQLDF